jgi:exportin-1
MDLCDAMKGKPNATRIRADLLYVCGQYPRFLKSVPQFLRVVIYQINGFMHCRETPALQDMAVDTFLLIARQCREGFHWTIPNSSEHGVSVAESLLMSLQEVIKDLNRQQTYTVYEAMGHILRASDDSLLPQHLTKLFEVPNAVWKEALLASQHTSDDASSTACIQQLTSIMILRTRVVRSLGHRYMVEAEKIFGDVIGIYKRHSEIIQTHISTASALQDIPAPVRLMRFTKREILKFLKELVMRSENVPFIKANLLSPILDAVLVDYKLSHDVMRDEHLLALITVIVDRLGSELDQVF